ncbi:MAG TPA: hypothetical protein VG733_19985 [Chthoniobacteraceae bacterium]|nr:hypothetical protein [Chthoniobacteraceae bacterium]
MNTQFTAKTRGGVTAYFSRVPPGCEVENGYGREPFVLLGYIRMDEPELWTATGRWRDDGEIDMHDLLLGSEK